jgi:hypothetical protein
MQRVYGYAKASLRVTRHIFPALSGTRVSGGRVVHSAGHRADRLLRHSAPLWGRWGKRSPNSSAAIRLSICSTVPPAISHPRVRLNM